MDYWAHIRWPRWTAASSPRRLRDQLGLLALALLLLPGRVSAPAPAIPEPAAVGEEVGRPSVAPVPALFGESRFPVEAADAASPVVADAAEPANRFDLDQRERVLSIVRSYRRTNDELECRKLAEAIVAESVAAGVDPLLVTSIVAVESSFRSSVVSHKGAVGLMQLRPFVARDVARRREIEWTGPETLHTPHLNVRLGINYYLELLERFDGDEQLALTAYNHGPTRVSRWVREGKYNGSSYAAKIETLRSRQTSPVPPETVLSIF